MKTISKVVKGVVDYGSLYKQNYDNHFQTIRTLMQILCVVPITNLSRQDNTLRQREALEMPAPSLVSCYSSSDITPHV